LIAAVAVRTDKIRHLPADIRQTVAQNNRAIGRATIVRNGEQAVVRGEGLLQSINDIGNIVLRTAPGGVPLYIKDVARLSRRRIEGPMPRLGAVTSEGTGQTVAGVALMTLGENTRAVAQRLATADVAHVARASRHLSLVLPCARLASHALKRCLVQTTTSRMRMPKHISER
jgi:Cu/Ag efflux pump CusA